MKIISKIISIVLIITVNSCMSVGYDSVRIKTSDEDATIIYEDEEHKGFVDVKTDGISDIELEVIHEDYIAISRNIVPKKEQRWKISKRETGKTGIVEFVTVFLTGTVLLSIGYFSNISEYITEEEREQNNLFMYSGGAIAALGLGINFYNDGYVLDWQKNYEIDMMNYFLYDKDGYHKKTGISKYGHNKNGEYINGDYFTGPIRDGNKEGYGIYYSKSKKTKYIGSFNFDRLKGYGVIISDNDISYGTYVNGYENGSLVRFTEEGNFIESWDGGKLLQSELYTTKVYSKYDLIVMENYNGLVDGQFDAISKDGKIQVKDGTFNNGRLVAGTLIYSSGLVLNGDFKNDNLIKGTVFYPDGRIYTGELKDGLLNGYGILSFSDNSTYEGELLNGVYDGQGSYTDASGNEYVGDFDNGIFSGNGKIEFYDGGFYQGDFKNGTYYGSGILVMGNGETFEGSFLDGLPHGNGIYKYKEKIQRAEYYQGVRIDQAYQMEKNLETYKYEQETKKKLEEQKRLEAKRLAAERQKQLELKRKKKQQKNNINKLLAGFTGFAIGEMSGFDTLSSLELGSELMKISEGDTSILESMLQESIKSLKMSTAGTYSGDQSVFVSKKIEASIPMAKSNLNKKNTDTRKIITKTVTTSITSRRSDSENEALKEAKNAALYELKLKLHNYGMVDQRMLLITDITFSNITFEFKEENKLYPAGYKASLDAEWTGRLYVSSGATEVMIDN